MTCSRVALLPQRVLLEAWQRRRRVTWPEGFSEAMADPLYARLVMIEALYGEAQRVQRVVAAARPSLPPAPIAKRATPGMVYWWQDRD